MWQAHADCDCGCVLSFVGRIGSCRKDCALGYRRSILQCYELIMRQSEAACGVCWHGCESSASCLLLFKGLAAFLDGSLTAYMPGRQAGQQDRCLQTAIDPLLQYSSAHNWITGGI